MPESGRLPAARLAAYGALGLPLAALNLPLYVYLPTFYATEVGLGMGTVGTVLLAARLLDVVSDPLLGELCDRTRSRFGQRRPWLVAAAPIVALTTWMLFLPDDGAGSLHLLAWSGLAYLAWTMMLLAYTAWGAELSADYHERTRIAVAREACVILGILVAAALPVAAGLEPASRASLSLLFWSTAGLLAVTVAVAVLFVGEPDRIRQEPLRAREALALLAANRPFRRLLLAYLLNGLAGGLPATLFLLFTIHVLLAPEAGGPLLLAYFASGVAAAPLWLLLSRRIGKHRAWAASMGWACAIFIWVPLLGPGDVTAFAAICLLSGASLGADLALPAAMQADVVDLDRARSGRRRTGLFFAIWSMATKLALAGAVGIAFPVLAVLGFNPEAVPGEAQGLLGLSALYGLAPVLFKLTAVPLVWRFELDAGHQAALRLHIEQTTRKG
ncbi:MFS transporter [Geminicoccaceae bacterium 1502E]|nr:MFS transporter [Geminicoccaceae bacterium 1502E]